MAMRDIVPFGPNRRRRSLARRGEVEDPFTSFHREIDRLFGDFFGRGLPAEPGTESGAGVEFFPKVDVEEKDKEIVVSAEVPGVEEKDIDVHLDDNMLVLQGEKEDREEKREGSWCATECSYGSFSRRIPLPTEVDSEKTTAKFKNGVLTVRLPKLKSVSESGHRVKIERE